MFVIRWCMSEIIDLTKNSISNCNLRQHAFFCKYICAHCFDWSSTYIMSIIVSNWQHCDEQQFRTLSCVHYTIFSVVKSDLFIRALLLDRILVTEKTTRTPRVHLVTVIAEVRNIIQCNMLHTKEYTKSGYYKAMSITKNFEWLSLQILLVFLNISY